MLHIIKPPLTKQTSDLLTGAVLWKPRAFQSEAMTKKRPPMRNVVVRSVSPSATPATQNEGRCQQVPRLPHNMDVDVTKCHACHTNCTLPILTVTMVLPFKLLERVGGGLGFTTVDASGFYLLGFWGGGGGLRVHDCSWFRVLEFLLSCANPDNTNGSIFIF